MSSPRRESPSSLAGATRPSSSSSWLEVDLASEMELEHGLQQPFAQPSPLTAAAAPAAAPVKEVAAPLDSTTTGAHLAAEVNSSSKAVPNAPAYGVSTQSNTERASPLPSPSVPPPTPVVEQSSPLVVQEAAKTSRQSPSPPPSAAEESMLAGSVLAARSAELLSKARSERSRLRKLRILINESSPERLAAVLSTEPAEAAKARGKAAADLDARGAALAAARAAAHAAGVADARASIQRPPSLPSPTKQLLDPLADAEFDSLFTLSHEAMAAIRGDEGGRKEDGAREEGESSGTVPQSMGPRRRPPQHRTSRRLKRSSARSPTPVSPKTESSSPSTLSSVPGLGVVTGLLRRIGFGSPDEQHPSEESNAATVGELKSGRVAPKHMKVAAIPAEIRTSTSISPGSSSNNDDDFHSADEGDEG